MKQKIDLRGGAVLDGELVPVERWTPNTITRRPAETPSKTGPRVYNVEPVGTWRCPKCGAHWEMTR